MPDQAPRLRSALTIDFTKATPDCARCAGTGRVGTRTLTIEGESLQVDVVCKCVTENGGVTKDKLDEILGGIQRDLDTGAFGRKLSEDIRRMPADQQALAVARLREACAKGDLPPTVETELHRALHLIGAPAGGPHGIPAPAQC